MAIKMVFKKQDLSIVPRWTDNIKDEWINPFITQTCEIDFRDTISRTLYDAIANLVAPILSGTQGLAWANQAYGVNDILVYQENYYIVVNPVLANENTPDTNANYQLSNLLSFWANYMKPSLVYSCYKRFILWHGKHIAQGGIRKHQDNTSFEINGDELAYLMADLRMIVGQKQTQMLNLLSEVKYTFDGVTYAENLNVNKPSTGVKIFSV